MPKEFSPEERRQIRESLIGEGRRLFARYGLKRTGVEELSRAVGIAKGSFYSFFSSKEDLFMAILEREEEFRGELLEEVYQQASTAREGILMLFRRALAFIENNDFLQQLYAEETYPQLIRKLGLQRIEAHQHKDEEELAGFVTSLQREGLILQEDPKVLVGMFRAMFLLTLHRREIGHEQFDRVMELTARVIARGLSTETGGER